MSEPCATLSWFPNHTTLQVGETYQFTAACGDIDHYVGGNHSQQGIGPLLVPFNPNPAANSAVWNMTINQGCQGVVICVRCFDHEPKKDSAWVCELYFNISVTQP